MKNRGAKDIERLNKGLARMSAFSISLYDNLISEITNSPSELDYHKDTMMMVYGSVSEQAVRVKELIYEAVSEYDLQCRKVDPSEYDKVLDLKNNFNIVDKPQLVYRVGLRVLNSLKYWRRLQGLLADDITLLERTVIKIKTQDSPRKQIRSIEYVDKSGEVHEIKGADKYIFWGGIETIHLAAMVGLRVPIYGFKGHSLNVYVSKEKLPNFSYVSVNDSICLTRVGVNTDGLVRISGHMDLVGNNLNIIEHRKAKLISTTK